MGDFNNNAFIRNEGYDYLINKGLIDTYNIAIERDNGITVKGEIAGWEGKVEDKRLDIIFTNIENTCERILADSTFLQHND